MVNLQRYKLTEDNVRPFVACNFHCDYVEITQSLWAYKHYAKQIFWQIVITRVSREELHFVCTVQIFISKHCCEKRKLLQFKHISKNFLKKEVLSCGGGVYICHQSWQNILGWTPYLIGLTLFYIFPRACTKILTLTGRN